MSQHTLLDAIDQELNGIDTVEPIDIGAHKYTMKVLERQEESYARTLLPEGYSVLQIYSDQSLPMLAVALRAIDNTPIEELFVPADGLSKEEEKQIQTTEGLLRWRRERVMSWLAKKPAPFIEEMWLKYMGLKNKVSERLEEMRPLSRETPSGELRPTSSPEKVSLSPTLLSNV